MRLLIFTLLFSGLLQAQIAWNPPTLTVSGTDYFVLEETNLNTSTLRQQLNSQFPGELTIDIVGLGEVRKTFNEDGTVFIEAIPSSQRQSRFAGYREIINGQEIMRSASSLTLPNRGAGRHLLALFDASPRSFTYSIETPDPLYYGSTVTVTVQVPVSSDGYRLRLWTSSSASQEYQFDNGLLENYNNGIESSTVTRTLTFTMYHAENVGITLDMWAIGSNNLFRRVRNAFVLNPTTRPAPEGYYRYSFWTNPGLYVHSASQVGNTSVATVEYMPGYPHNGNTDSYRVLLTFLGCYSSHTTFDAADAEINRRLAEREEGLNRVKTLTADTTSVSGNEAVRFTARGFYNPQTSCSSQRTYRLLEVDNNGEGIGTVSTFTSNDDSGVFLIRASDLATPPLHEVRRFAAVGSGGRTNIISISFN